MEMTVYHYWFLVLRYPLLKGMFYKSFYEHSYEEIYDFMMGTELN